MPMLNKDKLGELLPHAGAMRLLDCVERWDHEAIRCRTRSHRDPANPLRHGERLDAVAGVEYAAQAVGVHMGLLAERPFTGKSIGVVGGVRDVVFNRDRLDDCLEDLTIDAVRLFGDDRSGLYRFALSSGGRKVLSGRLSIFLEAEPAW
jgi:predicted hotdog family 3-hydroxylacyl-ACP dehydratase